MSYAGFWKRFVATFIDGIIITIIGFIFGIVMMIVGINNPKMLEGFGDILGFFLGWLYYAVMESSPTQGTVGKMALGIKVTDLDGNKIGFGKAIRQHFSKIISTLILFYGFIMVAFTEKKQCLHDMMAGCLVVNKW